MTAALELGYVIEALVFSIWSVVLVVLFVLQLIWCFRRTLPSIKHSFHRLGFLASVLLCLVSIDPAGGNGILPLGMIRGLSHMIIGVLMTMFTIWLKFTLDLLHKQGNTRANPDSYSNSSTNNNVFSACLSALTNCCLNLSSCCGGAGSGGGGGGGGAADDSARCCSSCCCPDSLARGVSLCLNFLGPRPNHHSSAAAATATHVISSPLFIFSSTSTVVVLVLGVLSAVLDLQILNDISYLLLLVAFWVIMLIATVAYVQLRKVIRTFVSLAEQHLQAQLMSLSAANNTANAGGTTTGLTPANSNSAGLPTNNNNAAAPGAATAGAPAGGVAAAAAGTAPPVNANGTAPAPAPTPGPVPDTLSPPPARNQQLLMQSPSPNPATTIVTPSPQNMAYSSRPNQHYGHQVDTVVIQRGMRVLGVFLGVSIALVIWITVHWLMWLNRDLNEAGDPASTPAYSNAYDYSFESSVYMCPAWLFTTLCLWYSFEPRTVGGAGFSAGHNTAAARAAVAAAAAAAAAGGGGGGDRYADPNYPPNAGMYMANDPDGGGGGMGSPGGGGATELGAMQPTGDGIGAGGIAANGLPAPIDTAPNTARDHVPHQHQVLRPARVGVWRDPTAAAAAGIGHSSEDPNPVGAPALDRAPSGGSEHSGRCGWFWYGAAHHNRICSKLADRRTDRW